MKKSFIILSCFLCSAHAWGQGYYPGGLSNANLYLWLDANDLATITKNVPGQVSKWNDKSSPSTIFSVGQPTTASQPLYTASGINVRPSMSFTAGSPNQYFQLQVSDASAPNSYFQGFANFSHFCVFSGANTPQVSVYGKELIWKVEYNYNAAARMSFFTSSNGSGWTKSLLPTTNIPANTAILTSAVYNSAGYDSTYYQGAPLASVPVSGEVLSTNTYNFTLGARSDAAEPLTGKVGELLFFNRSLLNSERIIIENYLSAKWGIALSANSGYTPPTSTTYTTNLLGIGSISSTDNVRSTAQTDGLGFSSGITASDFLNTAGYLMAAHDGQANTIQNNIALPGFGGSSLNKWNRSWYLQRKMGNSSGAVTLNFNFTDYNSGTAPSSTNNFAILYNATDGSFSTGTNQLITTTGTSFPGNSISFTAMASSLLTGYYTLVWSASAFTLPVMLNGFTATEKNNNGLLEWATLQESGSHHFDIERGIDGAQFTAIGTVAAKGTSSITSYYSFTDNKPLTGFNYYRLKMVDVDGAVSYSTIRLLNFGTGGASALSIYPNPMMGHLYLSRHNSPGIVNIRMLNKEGQVVRELRPGAVNTVNIPVNDLPAGVYFIEVNTGVKKYIQKVLKN